MRILVDVDDVTNNMFKKTALVSNERWGTNYDTSTMSIPKWDWEELKAHDGRLYKMWLEPNFFSDVEPWEGALEVIPRLVQKHEIIFVTASHYSTVSDKAQWLERHFPFVKFSENVIITGRKELVDGDLMFDDNSQKNLAGWKKTHPKGIGIAMMAGYNDDWPIRVEDWFEFEVLVEYIDKMKKRLGDGRNFEYDCRLICNLFRDGYRVDDVMKLLNVEV